VRNDAVKEGSRLAGKYVIFWTIEYDHDVPNPLEDCDGMGKIYSLNRKHINYDHGFIKKILKRRKSGEEVDVVKLSYFEHGLCRWMVAGTPKRGMAGDWRWDGVDFAGIWVPDDCLIKEAEELTGEARDSKMIEWAEQACEIYTDWCNGNFYGYTIKSFRVDDEDSEEYEDYEHESPIDNDSCWGYYGLEYIEDEVESLVNQIANRLSSQEPPFVDPAMA